MREIESLLANLDSKPLGILFLERERIFGALFKLVLSLKSVKFYLYNSPPTESNLRIAEINGVDVKDISFAFPYAKDLSLLQDMEVFKSILIETNISEDEFFSVIQITNKIEEEILEEKLEYFSHEYLISHALQEKLWAMETIKNQMVGKLREKGLAESNKGLVDFVSAKKSLVVDLFDLCPSVESFQIDVSTNWMRVFKINNQVVNYNLKDYVCKGEDLSEQAKGWLVDNSLTVAQLRAFVTASLILPRDKYLREDYK